MGKYMANVKCKDLYVDPSYQRELIPSWLKRIINDFDLDQTRPLILSKRTDGKLFVIDGNHTRFAMMAVNGDDAVLPATIYEGLSVKDEAEMFAKMNSNSKKVTFNEKLRARISSGDEAAIAYINALNASGINWKYVGGGGFGPFVAHQGGMKLYETFDEKVFIEALEILKSVGDKKYLVAQVLGGICFLLTSFPNINRDRLVSTLKKETMEDVQKQIKYYGYNFTGGIIARSKVVARVLLDFYNIGLRRNKLVLQNIA